MLRIPKHGIIALDRLPSFARGSYAGQNQSGGELLSFRDMVIRGIVSAVLIVVFMIMFLL